MQKSFALALLAATVVQAAPGRQWKSRNDKKRYNDNKFNAFMSKFNKNISSTAEFDLRQECYHKTDAKINAQNAKSLPGDKWALRFEHNMFSDMDDDEFAQYMGLNENIPHKENSSGLPMHSLNRGRGLADLPQTVDWASKYHNTDQPAKMFAVKNQGSCGSCWAFAVTSTLEGTLAIKSNSDPWRISEQQGVDCTLTFSQGGDYNEQDWGCWGCEGCWMSNHYRYLMEYGAMKESDYAYQGVQLGECNYDADKVQGKVARYTVLDSVDEMKERASQQPLDVAVCASGWSNFGTGVVRDSDCCKGLNHAVTVVGYNLCDGEDESNDNDNDNNDDNDNDNNDGDDGDITPTPTDCSVDKWWYSCNESTARRLNDTCVPYWIIQNSWGTWWGDDGFVKLEITDGEGTCGINKVAEYADWTSDMYV